MGIVIDQSIKNTLSTYLGFAIGALNTLVFYTHFMSATNYGIVALMLSIATVATPFFLFGSHQMLIRYFPKYDEAERGKLLSFSLLIPSLMALILGVVVALFEAPLTALIKSDAALPEHFVWYVYAIGVFMAFFEFFYAMSRVMYQSVMGNFTKEVFHRLLIALALIALYVELITIAVFWMVLVLVYGLRALVMIWYSLRVSNVLWSRPLSSSFTPLVRYALVMLMGSAAALVILEVDKIMINQYLDLDQVAYYTVAVFIATLVAVPFRAMHQITLPITAKYIANQDVKSLKNLYKESSINLSIVSALVLLLLLVNIESLYSFIPQEYSEAIFVVYVLGFVKFIDASLGINNAIINNAPFYAYVLAFGAFLALVTVVFNMWLLPIYGIMGAAYASLLALVIYNLLKLILVVVNYKMQPYSLKTLVVVLIAAVLYLAVNAMSDFDNAYVSIVLKSTVVVLIYLGMIYKLKLSTEINRLIDNLIRRS